MTELDPLRVKLKEHLLTHAVKTGDFVLKSGRKSSWFIDGKQTVCTPQGIQLIAEIILGEVNGIDAFGGLTMGADPVAYGVAAIAADRGQEIRSFSVRKESKGHGVEGRIAGALRKGDRVAITEDVVTRGVSPLEAAEAVRAFGAEPVMIISVVDRGGTCEQLAKEAGISFHTLLTAPDLGFEYEGP
jgi:orotate phosphoribosyltransferase